MKKRLYSTLLVACGATLSLSQLALSQIKNDKDEERIVLSPFSVDASAGASYGATPGGAQDIDFARVQIRTGTVPHPSSLRAEGLFSEHDLPLRSGSCETLLCVNGEAIEASLLELPDVQYLAQLGFDSGIDPATWRRKPLNLVAVVDKSGSMNGRPLELVRQSLLAALEQLGPQDQLSIVLYGDRSHTHLAPTPTTQANRDTIRSAIKSISSAGSTYMEAGLTLGYELARQSAETFEGQTRLMLFTDEQPNVGDTSAAGFMALIRRGAAEGYGLTTIGVSTHFGAELAQTLSSVKGGNLFYFSQPDEMTKTFETEFDTMVTELAHNMKLEIRPGNGYAIAGLYGIPNDQVQWTEDQRGLRVAIETLFLSKRKGAIYFTVKEASPSTVERKNEGGPIATTHLSYQTAADAEPVQQRFAFTPIDKQYASRGLTRGEYLVNEYVSLKAATTAYHTENDAASAYHILSRLKDYFSDSNDHSLGIERETIAALHRGLGRSEGFSTHSEDQEKLAARFTGHWVAYYEENPEIGYDVLFHFRDPYTLTWSEIDSDGEIYPEYYLQWKSPLGDRRHGRQIANAAAPHGSTPPSSLEENGFDREDSIAEIRYRFSGDRLNLILVDGKTRENSRIKLRRYEAKRTREAERATASVDPLSGLPDRSR